MPSNNLTSIIILGYNQLEYTKLCIESIYRYTPPSFELILVDNGSTDGTAEYFDSIAGAKVIKNKINQGFIKGCNQGIEVAEGNYILFLNNDTIVTKYWLENLIACLRSEPNIGVVGPRSNYADGRQFIETSYTTVEGLHRFAEEFNRRGPKEWFEVNIITGFCMLIKREVIDKTGTFNERFSIGDFEDNDFCARARAAGYRSVCAGNTFIHHFGNRAFIGDQLPYDSLMKQQGFLNGGRGISKPDERADPDTESLSQIADGGLFVKAKLAIDKFEAERGELSKLFHQGLIDYVDGRYDKALHIFQELAQELPSSTYVKHSLGLALMMLGKFNEAKGVLTNALQQQPGNANLLLAYGDCLAALGDLSGAERHYREALELRPSRVSARMGLAVVEKIKRQPELLKFINDLEAVVNLKAQLAKERSERLSITYITANHAVTGGQKIYLEHINRLIERGHSVSVISHWSQPDWFNLRTEVVTIPFSNELCDYVSPESDLVIATSWPQVHNLIKIKDAAHAYFAQDDRYLFEKDEGEQAHCFLPAMERLADVSHNLPIPTLVISEGLGELVQKRYDRESTTIPAAIDLNTFKPRRRRRRQKLKLLMIGADDLALKGLHYINEAFQRVKQTHDVEVIWVSSEPRKSLQIKCDTFIQAPSQAELANIYAGCDIFVSTSMYEGSSLPPVEAMACGTPVIVAVNEGTRGYIRDGRNCLAVPACDTEAVFIAINRLLDDDLLRERIIKGGLETAAKYNWKRTMNMLEEKLWNLALTPKIPFAAVLPEEAVEKSAEDISNNVVNDDHHCLKQPNVIEFVPIDARRVLDVGCAAGRTLKERGVIEVVGIETVKSVAEEAKQYLDRVIVGDIEQIDLDYKDGYFDCIILADTIEHFYNPWQVLVKLRRYLAPEGKIICGIPNIGHISILHDLLNGSWKYGSTGILDITHLRFFTLEGAFALLMSAGFKIENIVSETTCSPEEKTFLDELKARGLSTDKFLQHATTCKFLITAAPLRGQPHMLITMPAGQAGAATGEDQNGDLPSSSSALTSRFVMVSGSAEGPVKRPKLSLAMVVKDEADNLERCLKSVQGVVDEIVIVDIGSTDNTAVIAQELGAKVIHYEGQGDLSAARNVSLEHSTGEWIMLLNANEELAREDIMSLRGLLEDTEHEGFFLNMFSFVDQEEEDGAVVNLAFRLWRNKSEYRFSGPAREQVVARMEPHSPNIGSTGIRINHYGYWREATKKDSAEHNLSIFLKEVEEHPYDFFARLNLGVEYLRIKDYEKALDQYKKAFANLSGSNPSRASMLVRNIALCLKWLDRYPESLRVLQDAKEAYPDYTDLFYTEGLVHLARKDFTSAIKCFESCLAMGQTDSVHISQPGVRGHIAARALAYARREVGDDQQAVLSYRSALEDNPGDCLAASELGLMLIYREHPDDLKHFLESLVDMTSEGMLFTLSLIFGQGGYYDISLGYLDKLDGTSSNSSRAIFLRGGYLLNLKKYHEAVAEFSRIYTSSQFYPAASINRTICHLLLGEYEDAARAIDGIKSGGELRLIHHLYSSLISLMGGHFPTLSIGDDRKESSCQVIAGLLGKFLELEEFEAFESAVELLEKFNLSPGEMSLLLGKIYYNAGYDEMAVEELVNAYENGYADGEAFLILGRTASGNGFHEEAKTFFSEALSKGVEELILYVSLGRTLIKLGEIDRAIEILDMGAKRYPNSPLITEVKQSINALV